ncbi:hypothetical protein [Flavobacterium caeni]|uniref:Lipoprotein n=1 Tax=Flavobacterium caeni TaxID=490189 RepID=A0A1G5KKX7_9FLAO|nr:hypothetical protein [Flavobacterium caeni]SCZ01242.1 hypothetical protein SAMN02927903_03360 [Flavobacterium caeni]
MQKTTFILLILFAFGCTKKEHLIEIYTFKTRANNLNGINAEKYLLDNKKIDPEFIYEIGKTTTIDTLKQELIYAGEFKIEVTNLNTLPFITDKEILSLDTEQSKLKLSKSACEKISQLPGFHREGLQFVITDNRIPIFSGYFWSTFSSYGSHWYCLSYKPKQENCNEQFFDLTKADGMKSPMGTRVNFRNFNKMVESFKYSNRLNK